MWRPSAADDRGLPFSSDRDKRRKTVLLRGLLIFAVGGLLITSGERSGGFAAVALLALFAASDLLLAAVPLRRVISTRFEVLIGAADVVIVGLGIHLAGAARGVLPISCLLMVLVVALGNYRAHAVAGTAAVAAFHSWMVLGPGPGAAALWQLAMQVLFLCAVALYYGYLVGRIHRTRRTASAQHLQRRELSTLVTILDAITSTLELRDVTRTIVSKITSIIPAIRCSMLFVNTERTRCYVMASHDDPHVDMLEIDLDKYPEVRKAIETRDPVLVEDVARDPLMDDVKALFEHLDFQSILVVPLTFGSDVLGTICLKTARADTEFTENEIHFLRAVSRASANALKNALLHQQVAEESGRHRATGEQLASILDNSPDLILTTDTQGRITEFNRGATQLLGYDRGNLLGRSCRQLLAEARDADLVERILDQGTISNYACHATTRDGSIRDLELNMSALLNDDGEISGTVWLGRDVTELKSTQMQLIQAEKLSTIGQVISGVAHELNNPLSGVLGYSQLLMMRDSDSPASRELEKINESALRCQKIVKNLLSFAREHKAERKYLGVNGIIRKTLDLRKYQLHVNNIDVVCELDHELPYTMVDFHQMQQVLLNLIHNAQQAMAAVRDRPGRLEVRTSQHDGQIRIEIGDNGEGMDEETLGRIFDPFFTTKEQGQGTGLGLSVSYGIIKEHGGRIYANSRPGEGTRFVLELPICADEEEHAVDVRTPSMADLGVSTQGERLLLVDDEPVILDLLLGILQDGGFKVDTASNGEEALRKIGAGDYDVIITDVRMPQMDGMELYRKVMASKPEMQRRMIFITGDLIDDETGNFLAEINAIVIPKPLEIPQVLETVRATLRDNAACAPA